MDDILLFGRLLIEMTSVCKCEKQRQIETTCPYGVS